MPVAIDPTGVAGPTKGQAEGSKWRRTSRGFYVPNEVDGSLVEQRILEATAVLPSYGGVTGWAALCWMGGHWFSGFGLGGTTELPVRLATGATVIRAQPGIRPSTERLDPRDLTSFDSLSVTTAVRSVCFEMRYAPSERRAVVDLDMAAYSDLVSLAELGEFADRHSGWTGIPQCRSALTHADENSWSPRETLMRLVWTMDAGLPRPLCNVPVFDRNGRHIGTPDLLDPAAGVIGEYDSSLHLEGRQRHKDVSREGDFRSLGLEYATMLAGDWGNTRGFIRRLHGAYERARWVDPSRRAWTLAQPAWWTDTSTVAKRRALEGWQRDRLLRLRVG